MSRFAKQIFLAGFFAVSLAGIASAQGIAGSASCQDLPKMMEERKGLIDQLNAAGKNKKQLDAKVACNIFTKLSNQGGAMMKWFGENKEWCQVPDEFVEGFKKDAAHVSQLRGQACKVAAQMDAARKNPQGGGVPPNWGGGVNGQYQMPKGAL